jgi:apolipoprotein N-acyltransferase
VTSSRQEGNRPGPLRLRLEKFGLSVLAGLLFIAAFARPDRPELAWLGFLAPLPLLLLHAHPRWDALWSWSIPGLALFEIWKYHGTAGAYPLFTPLLLALVLGPPVLLFPLMLRFGRRRLAAPLVLLAPVLWTATEWFRIHLALGNAAFLPLGGNLSVYSDLLQIADLLGIYGLAALSAAVAGALADMVLARSGSSGAPARWPRWASPAVAAGLLLLAWGYGALRLSSSAWEEGPRVGVLQPNLPHDGTRAYQEHRAHVRLTRELLSPGSVDLIAWPENAILEVVDGEGAYYLGELGELAAEMGAPLFVGGLGWDEEAGAPTNAMWLVPSSGEPRGRYDKQMLSPWTEYLPFSWLTGIVPPLDRAYRGLVRRLLGYVPEETRGSGPVVFELETAEGSYRFGAIICMENMLPDLAREQVRAGAQFLFNPTSEGDFGRHVYYNTWANCVIRAVENRVGIVRVGNNGISGFIGPDGHAHGVLSGPGGGLWLTRGHAVDRVRVDGRSPTFFTRYGGAIGLAFPVAAVVLMALAALRPRRRQEGHTLGRGA